MNGTAEAETQVEHEARAFALSTAPGEHIRPRDLQSTTKGGISFNAACRVLEDLEKDGELFRSSDPGGRLVWTRSRPPGKPSRGYALPLSSREHGALLRGLDEVLAAEELLWTYEAVLREMRTHAAVQEGEMARWVAGLDAARDEFARRTGRSPETMMPDRGTLRAIRNRLKRPA